MGLGQNLESAGPLRTLMNRRPLQISESTPPIGCSTHSRGLEAVPARRLLRDAALLEAAFWH